MATIIKRVGKKGVTYKIQVCVTDQAQGKKVTRSTTWKPEKGMTEKEIDREVIVFSSQYEEEVRQSFLTVENEKGNVNITFRELSEKWLNYAAQFNGPSYRGLAEEGLEKVLPLIGGYKVKEVTPSIVQAVFDRIDKFRKIKYTILPKLHIKEILERNGTSFVWIRHNTELNQATLSRIYNGLNIGMKYATMLAEVCKLDKHRLFDITQEELPYAQATLKRFKLTVYNVLNYAVRLCIVKDNYASAKYIRLNRIANKGIKCMNEDEIEKFYSALREVDNIQWRVSVEAALLLGLRRGEICGLNWEDIDFERKQLYVQRSYTECPKKGVILKEPKTEKSRRHIAIPELFINELIEYRKWYEAEKEKWGDRWVESGSVFVQRHGERIHPANIKMWVGKTCALAKIPHYSVHSLRHTNITLQLMAGVPLVTVSGRAGHSRTSTTSDIYAYFVRSSDREAANTLDNLFSNIPKVGDNNAIYS